MFPANFIEIKIPIKSDTDRLQTSTVSAKPTLNPTKQSSTNNNKPVVRVLYDFNAETLEDLTIRVNYKKSSKWMLFLIVVFLFFFLRKTIWSPLCIK
jgi:hypothetical protein